MPRSKTTNRASGASPTGTDVPSRRSPRSTRVPALITYRPSSDARSALGWLKQTIGSLQAGDGKASSQEIISDAVTLYALLVHESRKRGAQIIVDRGPDSPQRILLWPGILPMLPGSPDYVDFDRDEFSDPPSLDSDRQRTPLTS